MIYTAVKTRQVEHHDLLTVLDYFCIFFGHGVHSCIFLCISSKFLCHGIFSSNVLYISVCSLCTFKVILLSVYFKLSHIVCILMFLLVCSCISSVYFLHDHSSLSS